MIPETILKKASIRELYRFTIENRISRKALFAIVSARLRRELVEENAEGRPRRVQELKHAYMMALFHGFDRAMTRGYVSRNVTERLLDVVLENIIVREETPDEIERECPMLVIVSPTGACNLRCTGCYAAADAQGRGSLEFEIFDRIVREKRALWNSRLTVVSGGEPFLWRDGGLGLLDLAAKHPSEFFLVYTNGALITEDVARRMGELGNVTPAVSLEGFEAETDERRGPGTFATILAVFERMRRHGVPFGVSVTPTSRNWDVVTSDRFIDFCFEEQGAVYCWSFQYLPIGRAPDMSLVVPPGARLEMLRRTHHIIRDRKVLYADFWNSGVVSYGCISAGRRGGHFHIDWNGDVAPCVFIPFAVDNIHDVYERGGTLETVRQAPFFRKIREWQDEVGYKRPAKEAANWLLPCPMRDHFDVLRRAAVETGARPMNEAAAQALADPAYGREMLRVAAAYEALSEPVWRNELAESPRE